MVRRDLEDPSEEHSARAGDRVVLFSTISDGLEDPTGNRGLGGLSGGRAGLLHLAEAGGVDVEGIDRQEQLTRVDPGEIVVYAQRRLRESPLWLERSVGAEGVASRHQNPCCLAYLRRRIRHG